MNGSFGSTPHLPVAARATNHACIYFLTAKVRDSSVRILDLCFFQPAAIFLIYLILSACLVTRKLRISPNVVVLVIYLATFAAAVINCVRPIVNVLLHSYGTSSEVPDKILWALLRFTLLSAELSLFSVGCANSRRYKRLSEKSILALSITVSLVHGVIQGCVDLTSASPSDIEFTLGFGGIKLAICTSVVCFLIYLSLLVMLTMRRNLFFHLPAYFHLSKTPVYVYCIFLLAVYSTLLFGGIVFFSGQTNGLCAIAFSSFLYYLFYAPLVYVLFLRGYFSSRKRHLAFLYQSDLYRSRDVGLSVNSGDIRVPSYTAVACNSDPPYPLPVSSMLMARSGTALVPPAKSHALPTTAFDSCVSTNLNKGGGGYGGGDDDAELDWASRQLLGDRRSNRDEDVSPILSRAPGMCRDDDGLRRIGELLANPEGLLSVEDDEDFYTGQPNPARFETVEHH